MLYLRRIAYATAGSSVPLDESVAHSMIDELQDLIEVTQDTVRDLDGATEELDVQALKAHEAELVLYNTVRNWLLDALA